jgi:DNA segregation ATPase FtsK/SpoIIIE, S-DNA-T family
MGESRFTSSDPIVLTSMSHEIERMFAGFNSPVEIVDALEGYNNYHFFLRPTTPMRMRSFVGYLDDLKFTLGNDSVRIEAPIPNQKLVGITVPKKEDFPIIPYATTHTWEEYVANKSEPVAIPLGTDEFHQPHMLDLTKAGHVLMSGMSGSGLTNLTKLFITSLLTKNTPDDLRMILIDPTAVEFSEYENLLHLLVPPISSAKMATQTLHWLYTEMERRYDVLVAAKTLNISSYHHTVYQPAKAAWEDAGAHPRDRGALPEPLPHLVLVINEFSNLVCTCPQETEAYVVRLLQMSRAVGIHLIIATNRLSPEMLPYTILANIPTTIALKVAGVADSATLLQTTGAEQLRGAGDLLYTTTDAPNPIRLQALYVEEADTQHLIQKWNRLPVDAPLDAISSPLTNYNGRAVFEDFLTETSPEDELYEDAKAAVLQAGKASTSYLQRKLRIGYSRAARLIDLLEDNGVIGPADGSRPRDILI